MSPTRRDVLRTAAAVTALSAGRLAMGPQPATNAAHASRHRRRSGTVSMAMHIHSSWSEGVASMQTHLDQATRAGVDVSWWTDHDFRMAEHGFPDVVHMNGPGELVNGVQWTWAEHTDGALATSELTWDTAMASPGDDAPAGSLLLSATSSGPGPASIAVQGSATNSVVQRSVYGQTIEIDVFPTSVSVDSTLSVTLTPRWRPAMTGRPAGEHTLTYIVDGTQDAGRTVSGLDGRIRVPARQGQWNTLRLMIPERDLARFWPDIDSRDAAMFDLTLSAVSTVQRPARGWFDLVRISRPPRSANAALRMQAAVMKGYSHRFPAVRQYQGLEVSLIKPSHVNWFGPRITMPEFKGSGPTIDPDPAAGIAAVELIHSSGGLASYNHPFGTAHPAELPPAGQDALRAAVVASVLGDRAIGCAILEVGYPSRGGVDLDRHSQLWDVCSRNALFLTGTGLSDDYSGQDWLGQESNFVTYAHARSRELHHLLPTLSAGDVFFADPALFAGTIELIVDGAAPMGSVTISRERTRNVRVACTGLPAGSVVRVVRGTVNLAGPGVPEPGTSASELPASDWRRGYVDLGIDTSAPRFVRVEVRTAAGQVIALSNPVWLLRDDPTGDIPDSRRPTGSR